MRHCRRSSKTPFIFILFDTLRISEGPRLTFRQMCTVMIRLDRPRWIRRVNVQRIEMRADLLDGSEVLNDGGAGFENPALGCQIISYGPIGCHLEPIFRSKWLVARGVLRCVRCRRWRSLCLSRCHTKRLCMVDGTNFLCISLVHNTFGRSVFIRSTRNRIGYSHV
jgi:hypothetical protein